MPPQQEDVQTGQGSSNKYLDYLKTQQPYTTTPSPVSPPMPRGRNRYLDYVQDRAKTLDEPAAAKATAPPHPPPTAPPGKAEPSFIDTIGGDLKRAGKWLFVRPTTPPTAQPAAPKPSGTEPSPQAVSEAGKKYMESRGITDEQAAKMPVDELSRRLSAPPPKWGQYAKPGPWTTPLSDTEEKQFRQWVKANRIPFNPDDVTPDYDMRGYWKAQRDGDPIARRAANLHFPDRWKTPYHQTFSNQSQYALPTAGRWDGDTFIPPGAPAPGDIPLAPSHVPGQVTGPQPIAKAQPTRTLDDLTKESATLDKRQASLNDQKNQLDQLSAGIDHVRSQSTVKLDDLNRQQVDLEGQRKSIEAMNAKIDEFVKAKAYPAALIAQQNQAVTKFNAAQAKYKADVDTFNAHEPAAMIDQYNKLLEQHRAESEKFNQDVNRFNSEKQQYDQWAAKQNAQQQAPTQAPAAPRQEITVPPYGMYFSPPGTGVKAVPPTPQEGWQALNTPLVSPDRITQLLSGRTPAEIQDILAKGVLPGKKDIKEVTVPPTGMYFSPPGTGVKVASGEPDRPLQYSDALVLNLALNTGKVISPFTSELNLALSHGLGGVANAFREADVALRDANEARQILNNVQIPRFMRGEGSNTAVLAAYEQAKAAYDKAKRLYYVAQSARALSGAVGAGFSAQGAKQLKDAQSLQDQLLGAAQVLFGAAGVAGAVMARPMPVDIDKPSILEPPKEIPSGPPVKTPLKPNDPVSVTTIGGRVLGTQPSKVLSIEPEGVRVQHPDGRIQIVHPDNLKPWREPPAEAQPPLAQPPQAPPERPEPPAEGAAPGTPPPTPPTGPAAPPAGAAPPTIAERPTLSPEGRAFMEGVTPKVQAYKAAPHREYGMAYATWLASGAHGPAPEPPAEVTPAWAKGIRVLVDKAAKEHKISVPTVPPAPTAAAPQPTAGPTQLPEPPDALKPPIRPESQPASAQPTRPPGERWTSDRGAMPGEPTHFLDGDEETAKAAITPVEPEGEPGRELYRATLADGTHIGDFDDLDKASRAAEYAVDHPVVAVPPAAQEPKREEEPPAKTYEEQWQHGLTPEGRRRVLRAAGYPENQIERLSKTDWRWLMKDIQNAIAMHIGAAEDEPEPKTAEIVPAEKPPRAKIFGPPAEAPTARAPEPEPVLAKEDTTRKLAGLLYGQGFKARALEYTLIVGMPDSETASKVGQVLMDQGWEPERTIATPVLGKGGMRSEAGIWIWRNLQTGETIHLVKEGGQVTVTRFGEGDRVKDRTYEDIGFGAPERLGVVEGQYTDYNLETGKSTDVLRVKWDGEHETEDIDIRDEDERLERIEQARLPKAAAEKPRTYEDRWNELSRGQRKRVLISAGLIARGSHTEVQIADLSKTDWSGLDKGVQVAIASHLGAAEAEPEEAPEPKKPERARIFGPSAEARQAAEEPEKPETKTHAQRWDEMPRSLRLRLLQSAGFDQTAQTKLSVENFGDIAPKAQDHIKKQFEYADRWEGMTPFEREGVLEAAGFKEGVQTSLKQTPWDDINPAIRKRIFTQVFQQEAPRAEKPAGPKPTRIANFRQEATGVINRANLHAGEREYAEEYRDWIAGERSGKPPVPPAWMGDQKRLDIVRPIRQVAEKHGLGAGQQRQAEAAQPQKDKYGDTIIGVFPGGRVTDSVSENRIRIYFPDKDAAMRVQDQLKSRPRFRWTPSIKAWQAFRSVHAREAAMRITGATPVGEAPLIPVEEPTPTPTDKAGRADEYVNSIRNPHKREYARKYKAFLEAGGDAKTGESKPGAPKPPSWAELGLSYMTGQAVRTELNKIYEAEPADEPEPEEEPAEREPEAKPAPEPGRWKKDDRVAWTDTMGLTHVGTIDFDSTVRDGEISVTVRTRLPWVHGSTRVKEADLREATEADFEASEHRLFRLGRLVNPGDRVRATITGNKEIDAEVVGKPEDHGPTDDPKRHFIVPIKKLRAGKPVGETFRVPDNQIQSIVRREPGWYLTEPTTVPPPAELEEAGREWDKMDYGQRQAIAQRYISTRSVVHRISGSRWNELGPGEAQHMAEEMDKIKALAEKVNQRYQDQELTAGQAGVIRDLASKGQIADFGANPDGDMFVQLPDGNYQHVDERGDLGPVTDSPVRRAAAVPPPAAGKGYQSGMKIPNQKDLSFNNQVFATREEAEKAGNELMSRWTVPTGFEVVEVDKQPTHRFDDDQDRAVRLEAPTPAPAPAPAPKPTEADKDAALRKFREAIKAQEKGGKAPAFARPSGERPAIDPLVEMLLPAGQYFLNEGLTDYEVWSATMMADQPDLAEAMEPYLPSVWELMTKEVIAPAPGEAQTIEGTYETPTETIRGAEPVTRPGEEELPPGERPGAVPPTAGVRGVEPALQPSGPPGSAGVPTSLQPGNVSSGSTPSGDEALDIQLPESERRPVTVLPSGDIHIEKPEVISGVGEGLVQQLENNVIAIRTLRKIQAENRNRATPEEQETLVKFVGWGGLRDTTFKREGGGGKRAKLQAELLDGRYEGGKWIPGLLNEEEITRARRSSLYANYTSPEVIQGIYDVLGRMGFRGGRTLESSMGVGHFYGLMPLPMVKASQRFGFEIENISGAISKLLYPAADIHVMGFQETSKRGSYPLPTSYFDLAITNVPFGQDAPHDLDYNKFNLNLHNYFIIKNLDMLRPGGIGALITSKFTLDSIATKDRRLMADRADFLGAIRLPQDAFEENANTTVTTDIIFFRKRAPGAPYAGEPFVELGKIPDPDGGEPLPLNEYYIAHPEMMLGEMRRSGRGLGEDLTGLIRRPGDDPNLRTMIAGVLDKAGASRLIGAYSSLAPDTGASTKKLGETEGRKAKATDVHKEDTPPQIETPWEIQVAGQSAYQKIRGDDGMFKVVKLPYGPAVVRRIRQMFEMRKTAREIIFQERMGADDATLTPLRKTLGKQYDAFVKTNGALNSPKNRNLISDDPDFSIITGLEVPQKAADSDKVTYVKSDIFTKRTVRSDKGTEDIKNAKDAMLFSLNKFAGVNIPEMAGWLKKSEADVIQELGDLIFRDPQGGYVEAEEYLSGNVRQKLAVARLAAQHDAAFEENVRALEPTIPEDKPPHRIFVKLGSPWVPPEDIADFLKDLVKNEGMYGTNKIQVIRLDPPSGRWMVSAPDHIQDSASSVSTWGTNRYNLFEITEASLNSRTISLRQPHPTERGKTIPDPEATNAANQKKAELNEEFKNWLWKDADRAKRLGRVYNDNYNNNVDRKYDGSHLDFPGWNYAAFPKGPKTHQKDGVWRAMRSEHNTLWAHVAGSGKTFEFIPLAMEVRRIGRARKVVIVVHNDTLEQYRKLAPVLYPAGKFLIFDKKSMEGKNRQITLSRIATNDWDAVIIPESSFVRIGLAPDTIREHFQRELDELDAVIREARERLGEPEGGRRKKKDPTIRELEKAREKLVERMEKLLARHRRDTGLTWEDLGVDMLMVDESQEFIRDQVITSLRRVRGINTQFSQRGFDMRMKIATVTERNNGRGIVFGSGTPIRNTLGEAYVLQRYLDPQGLKDAGINTFDDWHPIFGNVERKLEFTAQGTLQEVEAMREFQNLAELRRMVGTFMDVKMAQDLDFEGLPELTQNKIESPMTDLQYEYTQELAERMDDFKHHPDPSSPNNPLLIYMDGRMANITMKFHDTSLNPEPDGKLVSTAKNVAEAYKNRGPEKRTQVVFLNFGVPMTEEEAATKRSPLDAYALLKDLMVKQGVPADQIAFIHDAKNRVQAQKIFDKMNRGDIAVLLATVEKGGIGINIQERLWQMHMVDVPLRPDQFEQALRRMLRQGNINPKVILNLYFVKGRGDVPSFDAVLFQKLQFKQKMFENWMRGEIDPENDKLEDISQQSFGELMAECTGNPMMIERHNLSVEVERLNSLRRSWMDNRNSLETRLAQARNTIGKRKQEVEKLERTEQQLNELRPDEFTMTIGEKTYTDRKEAAAALRAAAHAETGNRPSSEEIAKGGYDWVPRRVGFYGKIPMYLRFWLNSDTKRIGLVQAHDSVMFPDLASPIAASLSYDNRLFWSNDESLKQSGIPQEKIEDWGRGLLHSIEYQTSAKALEGQIAQRKLEALTAEESIPGIEAEIAAPFKYEQQRQKALDRLREVETVLDATRRQQGPEITSAVPTPEEQEERDEKDDDEGTGEGGSLAYSSPFRGVPAVNAPTQGDVVRLHDIGKRLRKVLDIPTSWGRVGGSRRRLGIFRVKPFGVRRRSSSSYDTWLHEWAHALHKVLWGTVGKKGQKLNLKPLKRYRNELGPLDYDYPNKQRLEEGFAEFVRTYLMDPPAALKAAPKFHAFFEGELNRPEHAEIQKALAEAQRQVAGYEAQNAEQRVEGTIRFDEKDPSKSWRDRFDKLVTDVYDELYPLKKATEELFDKPIEDVDVDKNPYILATKLRDRVKGTLARAMMEGALDYKTYEPIPGIKGLRQILQPLGRKGSRAYRDFAKYVISRTAVERMTKRPGMILPNPKADYEQTIVALDTKYPQFEQMARDLYAWKGAWLDYYFAADQVEHDIQDKIREMHQEHVPLYRYIDPDGTGKVGEKLRRAGARGFGRVSSPLRRAKGGTQEFMDPITSSLLNVSALIDRAERAAVNRSLWELSKLPDSAWAIEEVSPRSHPVTFGVEEIREQLEAEGVDITDRQAELIARIWRPTPERDPKYAIVHEGGRQHILEMKSEEFRNAVNSMRPQEINWLVRVLSKPARLLHVSVAAAPEFAIRHFLRHGLFVELTKTYPGAPFIGTLKGLASLIGKTDIGRAALGQGLGFSTIADLSREELARFLEKNLSNKAQGRSYDMLLRHPLEALEKLVQYGDVATRLPEFEAALKDSMARAGRTTPDREDYIFAAFKAGEVSINFARTGAAMHGISRLAAFQRARMLGVMKEIQSYMPERGGGAGGGGGPGGGRPGGPGGDFWHRKFGRGARPTRTVTRALALITIPSIIIYLWNRSDPDYFRLPRWRRAYFWNIRNPWYGHEGMGEIAKVHFLMWPKPWAFGYLWGTVPEDLLAYYDHRDPDALDTMAADFFELIMPDFVPTAAVAVVHWRENKDAFGRPIVPQSVQGLSAKYQSGAYTSHWARIVGRYTNESPAKVQQGFRDLTGNLGTYLDGLANDIDELAGYKTSGEAPATGPAGWPFFRAFVAREPGFDAEPIERFYQIRDQLNQENADRKYPLRGLETDPLEVVQARAQKFAQDNPEWAAEGEASLADAPRLKAFTDTAKDITDYRKVYEEIRTNPKLSGEQKQQQMLNVQRLAIGAAEKAMRDYPAPKAEPKGIRRLFRVPSAGAPQVGAEAR